MWPEKTTKVYKSCPKLVWLIKLNIWTPLQKLPKNISCQMLSKVAQSRINRPIWSHCYRVSATLGWVESFDCGASTYKIARPLIVIIQTAPTPLSTLPVCGSLGRGGGSTFCNRNLQCDVFICVFHYHYNITIGRLNFLCHVNEFVSLFGPISFQV